MIPDASNAAAATMTPSEPIPFEYSQLLRQYLYKKSTVCDHRTTHGMALFSAQFLPFFFLPGVEAGVRLT